MGAKPKTGNEIMYERNYWGSYKEKLKSREAIKHYELLREIDIEDMCVDVDSLMERLLDYKESYPYFDRLFIEAVSVREGCSEYRSYYYLLGERMETTKETESRIKLIDESLALEKAKEEEVKASKEAKELEQLRKLMEKHGDKIKK